MAETEHCPTCGAPQSPEMQTRGGRWPKAGPTPRQAEEFIAAQRMAGEGLFIIEGEKQDGRSA